MLCVLLVTHQMSVCQTAEYEQTPQIHSYSSVTLLPVSFLYFEKRMLNGLVSHVNADKTM